LGAHRLAAARGDKSRGSAGQRDVAPTNSTVARAHSSADNRDRETRHCVSRIHPGEKEFFCATHESGP